MTDLRHDESGNERYGHNGDVSPEDTPGELLREFIVMNSYGTSDDEVEVHSELVFAPYGSTSPVRIYVLSGDVDDELIPDYLVAAAIRWEEDLWQRNGQQKKRAASAPRRRPRDPNPSRPSHGTREKGSNGGV